MSSNKLPFLLGAICVGAVPVLLTLRLARLTLREIRDLHVIILEVKRRMSVATTASGERVSFDAGGDTERYGQAKEEWSGSGDVLEFLLHGRGSNAFPRGFKPKSNGPARREASMSERDELAALVRLREKALALGQIVGPFTCEEGEDLAEMMFSELPAAGQTDWKGALDVHRETIEQMRGAWTALRAELECKPAIAGTP